MESKQPRVEELMDKVLEHKMNEYESRLGLVESELRLISKDLNEVKAKVDVAESDTNNLHRETLRRFVEFADKLDVITNELKNVEQGLHSDEAAIERIREHEQDAVENVRKWEKKTVKNLKKQLTAKKTLDAVVKRLTTGKEKAKLETTVRKASTSPKIRTALVNAVLKDKKLRRKLVEDVLSGVRGKARKEKLTTKVAESALKKVRPKVRKAVKKAAKTAVKTAVSENK